MVAIAYIFTVITLSLKLVQVHGLEEQNILLKEQEIRFRSLQQSVSQDGEDLISTRVGEEADVNCRNLTFDFYRQCGVLQLRGFQSLIDDSFTACCWDQTCCDQMEQLLVQQCFQERCDEYDLDVLELVGAYHSLCTTNVTLPSCEDHNKEFSSRRCQELNTLLLESCGSHETVPEIFWRQEDNYEAKCCWSSSCCNITADYFASGCDARCDTDQQGFTGDHGSYGFGNGIAHAWQQICYLPPEQSQCQLNFVGDVQTDAGATASTEQTLEEATSNLKSNEYEVNGNTINGPSEIEGTTSEVQTLCRSKEQFMNENYGPNGPWTTTVKTFCNFTLQDIQTKDRQEIELCCDVTYEMFLGACDYAICYSSPIGLFNPDLFTILSLWQVLCRTNIGDCPITEALILASGGNSSEFQLIENSPLEQPTPTPTPITPTPTPTYPVDNISTELSIYDALPLLPMISNFYHAIDHMDLKSQISEHPFVTMFAPTNAAFSNLMLALDVDPVAVVNGTGGRTWNAQYEYLIYLGPVQPESLEDGHRYELQTLESSPIYVVPGAEGEFSMYGCCQENGARVETIAEFVDGYLWVIDTLLSPPSVFEAVQQMGSGR